MNRGRAAPGARAAGGPVATVMQVPRDRLIDLMGRLKSSVRKVFGAGPPSLVGGDKWQLDLSDIAVGDRPAAIKAAAAKCATSLPEGSALEIGNIHDEQLQRANAIAILVPDDEAAERLEQQQGVLSVAKPGGSSSWEIPIRHIIRPPPNCIEVTVVGWSKMPDQLTRPGVGKLILDAAGYAEAEVLAEYHPITRLPGCPVPIRLAEKLILWVKRPEGDPTLSKVPDRVEVEDYGTLRVYVAASDRTYNQRGRQLPPTQQQQRPPPPGRQPPPPQQPKQQQPQQQQPKQQQQPQPPDKQQQQPAQQQKQRARSCPVSPIIVPLSELGQLYERLNDPTTAALDSRGEAGPVWTDNPLADIASPVLTPGREDPILKALAKAMGPGSSKQLAAQKAQRLLKQQQQLQRAQETKLIAARRAREVEQLLAAAIAENAAAREKARAEAEAAASAAEAAAKAAEAAAKAGAAATADPPAAGPEGAAPVAAAPPATASAAPAAAAAAAPAANATTAAAAAAPAAEHQTRSPIGTDREVDADAPIIDAFGNHTGQCPCKYCRMFRARDMATSASQYEAASAAIVAAEADDVEAHAAAVAAEVAPAPVAATAAGAKETREPSFAGLARNWATRGLDVGNGGGVLPDAIRANIPTSEWRDRGRTRSSAGGSAPEAKRPHMAVLTHKKPAVATHSRSPRAKSPSTTATARERRFRQAHIAGPPQDLERYAADGRTRRAERLERAAPSQT